MEESRFESLLRQWKVTLLQYGKESRGDLDITSAQSVLLEHLLVCGKQETSLTEICAISGISKATISGMLKVLKNKGYLQMEAVPGDDRKKRIILTRRAYEVHDRIENSMKRKKDCLYKGITKEELESLEGVLERMISNLKQEMEQKNTE